VAQNRPLWRMMPTFGATHSLLRHHSRSENAFTGQRTNSKNTLESPPYDKIYLRIII